MVGMGWGGIRVVVRVQCKNGGKAAKGRGVGEQLGNLKSLSVPAAPFKGAPGSFPELKMEGRTKAFWRKAHSSIQSAESFSRLGGTLRS
jgi:hypothetical protein